MPASQKQKHLKSLTKPIWKRKIFWIVVIILFMMVAGLATTKYLQYQNTKAIADERSRFEQADKDIQAVADAIIATLGQPLKVDESKSCTRPSAKFTDAPLSCSIYSDLFYEAAGATEATTLLHNINGQVKGLWRFQKIETSVHLTSNKFEAIDLLGYDRMTSYQLISSKYIGIASRLNCNISGIFYLTILPPFESYKVASKSPYMLAVSLTCRDKAKQEYYKLRE